MSPTLLTCLLVSVDEVLTLIHLFLVFIFCDMCFHVTSLLCVPLTLFRSLLLVSIYYCHLRQRQASVWETLITDLSNSKLFKKYILYKSTYLSNSIHQLVSRVAIWFAFYWLPVYNNVKHCLLWEDCIGCCGSTLLVMQLAKYELVQY